MTTPVALDRSRGSVPLPRRVAALVAVALARILDRLGPGRIAAVLCRVRAGARPATYAEAALAREAVVAVSALCAGEGCVPRSIATALLCRLHGSWPTWYVGVRTEPFGAHAWVEAGGRPVGEAGEPAGHEPILVVAPP
jgi:hypothetical protein